MEWEVVQRERPFWGLKPKPSCRLRSRELENVFETNQLQTMWPDSASLLILFCSYDGRGLGFPPATHDACDRAMLSRECTRAIPPSTELFPIVLRSKRIVSRHHVPSTVRCASGRTSEVKRFSSRGRKRPAADEQSHWARANTQRPHSGCNWRAGKPSELCPNSRVLSHDEKRRSSSGETAKVSPSRAIVKCP